MRWIMAVALAVILAACGGGSSDGSSADPSSSLASDPPPTSKSSSSVSLPGSQITVSAYANNLAPLPAAVPVSILNPPPSEFTYQVRASGVAVTSADFSWQSSESGTLTINFPSPGTLGPGTYQGSVQLSVCADAACLQPIGGSPATLSVYYVVYPGTQPPASFTLSQGPGGIVSPLYTSQTTEILDNLSLYVTNPPSSGLWVRVTQPSSGYVIGVALEPYSGPTAVIGLSLKSPAALGSGIFNGSVSFDVCYDAQCQNPVPGGPVVEPLSFMVSLSAGLEYSIRNVALTGVSDVAWNSSDQHLYAATVSGGGTNSPSLVKVDPTAGSVESSLAFPVDLYHVAISDDGQYGYVSSRDQPTVYRVEIPSLTSDLQIPLGSMQMGPNTVYQMQVAPGNSQALAVSFSEGGGTEYSAGVAIFDGAVQRPNVLPPLPDFGTPASIAWGASASVLYAVRYTPALPTDLRELDIANVDASGLSVGTAFQIALSDPLGPVWYAAGRVYGTDGIVRDASTNATLGSFVIPDSYQLITLVPDVANARIFVLAHASTSSHLILFCYDAVSFAMRSVTDLGYDSTPAYPVSLVTWGTDGIAFTSSENTLVVLSGTFESTGSAASTMMKAISPARIR